MRGCRQCSWMADRDSTQKNRKVVTPNVAHVRARTCLCLCFVEANQAIIDSSVESLLSVLLE